MKLTAIFRRVMKIVQTTVNWQYASVYVYHIGILSRLPEEHKEQAYIVLRLLEDAGAVLKLEKYALSTKEMNCIGPSIRRSQLKVLCCTPNATENAMLQL